MAEMGRYCKAYPVGRFREFGGWKEDLRSLKKEKPQGGAQGEAPAETARVLADEDYLYLQENFVVTDGIFIDENIVFDDVTPGWKDFCVNTLKFEVPGDEPVETGTSAR
jgi:hypothetical protein